MRSKSEYYSGTPQKWTQLLSHCEANYQFLNYLLPAGKWKNYQLETTFGQKVTFKFLENSPYTTTLKIVTDNLNHQSVKGGNSWIVRLYHDAEVAEVMIDENGRQLDSRYPYPNRNMYSPDEKYLVNEHLNEWLVYCYNIKIKNNTATIK